MKQDVVFLLIFFYCQKCSEAGQCDTGIKYFHLLPWHDFYERLMIEVCYPKQSKAHVVHLSRDYLKIAYQFAK